MFLAGHKGTSVCMHLQVTLRECVYFVSESQRMDIELAGYKSENVDVPYYK